MNPYIAIILFICACTLGLIWRIETSCNTLWKQLHEIKEITAAIKKRML